MRSIMLRTTSMPGQKGRANNINSGMKGVYDNELIMYANTEFI